MVYAFLAKKLFPNIQLSRPSEMSSSKNQNFSVIKRLKLSLAGLHFQLVSISKNSLQKKVKKNFLSWVKGLRHIFRTSLAMSLRQHLILNTRLHIEQIYRQRALLKDFLMTRRIISNQQRQRVMMQFCVHIKLVNCGEKT